MNILMWFCSGMALVLGPTAIIYAVIKGRRK